MRILILQAAALILIPGGLMTGHGCAQEPVDPGPEVEVVPLPAPRLLGPFSLEEVIQDRRSIRSFRPDSMSLSQLSQLLWAAQGITDERGLRSAPSAGATFPLEILAVAGRVEGLAPGVYRYDSGDHQIQQEASGDPRRRLAEASLDQRWMADAPVLLVLTANYARTTGRYGDRGRRYVHMEVGHAGQNIYLQAEALELGTTLVGAFHDREVAEILGLGEGEEPLAILPVGVPR